MPKYNENEILIMYYDKKLLQYVDKTNQIQWLSEDSSSCRVKFYGSDNFYYKSYSEIEILKEPKQIELPDDTYLNGHKLNNYSKIIQFDNWVKIFFKNNTTRVFSKDQISTHSNLLKQGPNKILRFNYFMELAKESAYQDNEFLSSMYDKLDFTNDHSILSLYLNNGQLTFNNSNNYYIHPFGLNLSQKEALENAFSCNLSVIEGPPGTGKTQTILNIIANAVLLGKSVAVVSNNNAAIQNVKEKLTEYNLDFLVALLGNKDNKSLFFDETVKKEKPLEYLKQKKLNKNTKQLYDLVKHYHIELPKMYEMENKLAALTEKNKKYELEYRYYKNEYEFFEINKFKKLFKTILTSKDALYWKLNFENIMKISWFLKLKIRIFYKIKIKDSSTEDVKKVIQNLEQLYYKLKIEELETEIKLINKYLSKENFQKGKSNYELISLGLLKGELYNKYSSLKSMEYTYDNYRSNFNSFIEEFPVILSTSYALLPSADSGFFFDYLIIDEASQTDILSSILAMSCAKNMIVVGDTKQLPQIPINYLESINKELKENYNIEKGYDYFSNNILTSVLEIFESVPRVILKEHYRCHPDIINFCNEKFYDNQLIILTKRQNNESPLSILKTVPGNHARANPNGSGMYNQREIDEIKLVVKDLIYDSIGVITPFRYQADLMAEELKHINSQIEVDTVHKFQGRAKDYIILSTVANELLSLNSDEGKVEDFVSRSDLLNVAVSRAKHKLMLVVSDKLYNSKNNTISELIKYIRYLSPDDQIGSGSVQSIYDILYKDYEQELIEFRKKHNKKEIITELITLNLIEKVIRRFSSFKINVIMHYPLKILVKDLTQLTNEERRYVLNDWSHVDFTILNSLTKEPILAIEVDGIAYHEQDKKQSSRDEMKNKALRLNGISLLRLKTNESDEENRIYEAIKLSLQSQ